MINVRKFTHSIINTFILRFLYCFKIRSKNLCELIKGPGLLKSKYLTIKIIMAIIRTMYKKKEVKESGILLKLKAMDKKRGEKALATYKLRLKNNSKNE